MTSPKVVMDQRVKGAAALHADPERAWAALGWFGLLLAVVGLGDFVLAFIPTAFGTVEWEFGTVASVFAGLPLLTMGLAGILASVTARGRRGTTRLTGAALLLLGAVILVLLVIFLTDVPVAVQSVQGDVLLGVKKAVAKTAFLGIVFSGAYCYAGFRALRLTGKAT